MLNEIDYLINIINNTLYSDIRNEIACYVIPLRYLVILELRDLFGDL